MKSIDQLQLVCAKAFPAPMMIREALDTGMRTSDGSITGNQLIGLFNDARQACNDLMDALSQIATYEGEIPSEEEIFTLDRPGEGKGA